MGCLPGARDNLADTSHSLRVARHHAENPEIMQNIFGGDGFGPDAALGKGHVFGDLRIQVVADHEHIQVFGNGVYQLSQLQQGMNWHL